MQIKKGAIVVNFTLLFAMVSDNIEFVITTLPRLEGIHLFS